MWLVVFFFFNDTATTEIYTLSLHDALPILRFRHEIGVITGLVGAAGGVGGFFLAKTLGWSKGVTGSFTVGFTVFAVLAIGGLLGVAQVKTRWRTTWGAVSGARV